MRQRIWKFCGNVSVTFYLLLFITINLAAASFYVKLYPQIFKPLNNFLLQDWFRLYGQNHPDKIWWLWTMFGLLLALAFNTGICTLDRMINLLAKRKKMSLKTFLLKITPSFIHIFFLIMLSGHFISMVSGFNGSIPAATGVEMSVPVQVQVLDQHCDYYSSPELLKGSLKQCTVSLKLQAHSERTLKQISFLKPATWKEFSFHLTRDKKAKEDGLKIIIKHDPGLKLILPGFTALILLMLWYFPTLNKNNKGG
ncbi:MAG: hypothetical protein WC581_07545 [Thermodesulfovibrionales bacterium]